MKKWIIGLIVAGIVAGGGLGLALSQVQAENTNAPTTTDSQSLLPATTVEGLTDAQKQQLKDLQQSQKDTAKPLLEQIKQATQQLKEALLANPTNQVQLDQAKSTILRLEGQLAQSRTNLALQVKGIVGADKFGQLEQRLNQKGLPDKIQARLDQFSRRLSVLEQRMNQRVQGKLTAPLLSNLKEKLGLSDAQITQLKDLRTRTASALKGLRQELSTARKDLHQAILANPTDTAKIVQAQTTISSLRSQILETQINAALQVKQIVSPDVFPKIARLFMSLRQKARLF